MKAFLPSSSSASCSAFLSLSCIITRLAMEAKVRFMGAAEEVAGAVVEGEGGESVGELPADVSLEKDEVLGIWEVTIGVLLGAGFGDGGLVETVEDTAGVVGFGPSEEGGESISLEVVWGEKDTFLCSLVVSVEDGDLAGWDGAAGRSLETSEGGICTGEGRTGHGSWVLTAVGVDGKSFSIFPGIKKDVSNLSCK